MNELFQMARDSYLNNCAGNGLAVGTVSNYEKVLKVFERSADSHGYTEPSVQAVAAWKADMVKAGTKITTMSSYMSIAKHFFDWAIQMEFYTKNPFMPTVMPVSHIVSREKKRPYTKLLTPDEYTSLLSAPLEKFGNKENALRNRTIIMCLMTTAIRNSELRALTPADLDFEKGIIYIRHGKGDKARLAAFPSIAQNAVKDYLKSGYRPAECTDSDFLFGTKKNGWKQLERIPLSQMCEKIVLRITGRPNVCTHALRHACASIMWDNGVPIDEISALLGHESIATTQVYAERLRPTAPMENANKMFDDIFNKLN